MNEFIRLSLSGGILGISLWGALGFDRELSSLIVVPSIILTVIILWAIKHD